MMLVPVEDSKALHSFRCALWKQGDDAFGSGFLEHCVRQSPFVTKQGTIEEEIAGYTGKRWLNDIALRQPPMAALSINDQVLAVPAFTYSLDELGVALFIDEYEKCTRDTFASTRALDRALFWVGLIPLRFPAHEAERWPDKCVEQSLSLLTRFVERTTVFSEVPEQEVYVHARVLDLSGDSLIDLKPMGSHG